MLISKNIFSQELQWKNIEMNVNSSLRGLSVVDDSVAWASGSNGWIGKSINGGNNWDFKQVKGFEKLDFRSIYAFDKQKAMIANAGSPANIMVTDDGGTNWKVVYTNNDTAAFFDGMDFWNEKEGMIYGDPINKKMVLFSTIDAGLHWNEIPETSRPILSDGEASFAASGTGIRCFENKKIIIATGGKVSRLLVSENKGTDWKTIKTPIIQGEASTGIFSVACRNEKNLIIVGGDFLKDTMMKNHIFITNDGGKNWSAPLVPTGGYRECVEFITDKIVIATGPTGTDISYDGGIKWKPLSDEKLFHTIRKARNGTLIVAVGKGKMGMIK